MLDVSALLNEYAQIGDFLTISKPQAASLGLLSPDGVLNTDAVINYGVTLGDLLAVDKDTATSVGILTPTAVITLELKKTLAGEIANRLGITVGSDLFTEVVNSNGDLLTIDYLKSLNSTNVLSSTK